MKAANNPAEQEMNGFWSPPGDKFTIGTVDGELFQVGAQYNPKELAFTSSASWHEKAKATDCLWFEYTTSESRTLTVELLFDGYENRTSVEPLIAQLEGLTMPSGSMRRPQLCVAVWGKAAAFRCIVQSVATKLTMFSHKGEPLRATCTVVLKEVDVCNMLEGGRTEDAGLVAARARSKSRRALDKKEELRKRFDLE